MADELATRLQAALGSEYTLGGELGGGGMSRVFRARQIPLNREVVVKVLPPELAGTIGGQRFRHEVAVAARLQHPLIVPLLTAGEMDGVPWFTMPFVDGESLRDRLFKSPGGLAPDEALPILRDVARALSYAHEQGVVHRDIKPGNVLISHGAAAIADFGIARAIMLASDASHETLTSTGVSLGTPAYMAPEQAASDPRTDHRADLYSFGVMAFEMLEGRLPFANMEPSQQMAAKFTEPPPPMSSAIIPEDLRAILAACMAPVPSDRPASAEILVRQLEQKGQSRRTMSRRPAMAVAGVAAAIVIGFVLFTLLDSMRTRPQSVAADSAGSVSAIIADLPQRDLQRPPIIPRDSTRMIIYAVGDSDGAFRGRAVIADSAARVMRARLASIGVMEVELVQPRTTPRGDSAVRADLTERNARLAVVISIPLSRDSLRPVAVVHDRLIPASARPPCEITGRVFAREQIGAAINDIASRLQGSMMTSFSPGFGVISYGRTRIPILRCHRSGVPYEAVQAYENYRRAEDRRDRTAMLTWIDALLLLDSTSTLAAQARSTRAGLQLVTRPMNAAAWDSANPPPEPSAAPRSHLLYRLRRATALSDVREQLAVSRELAADRTFGGATFLMNALLASNRPDEVIVVANAEETRLTSDTLARNRPPTSYLYANRAYAYWLLRSDSAMLDQALKVITAPSVPEPLRQNVLSYALQATLSAGDTVAYTTLLVRYGPDAPVARANLLSNGMSFSLAEGDTAAGRRLAERVVREFDHLLGQPDIPHDLAIPLANAHRRLGSFDRSIEILSAAERSTDAVLSRNARLHLVRVAAQKGDEATVARLTAWIEGELSANEPFAALLTMARLRATQGNLVDAWNYLKEYHARGLTQWHAGLRVDPDLSRLRRYEPARVFFEPVR